MLCTMTISTLLTDQDLAEILGITAQAVTIRRLRGEGPPWLKLGASKASPVRYRPEDVEAWLADRQVVVEKVEAAGE